MNILRWFTAGTESAEKVLDAGIRGLDALILTDEEKMKYNSQMAANWLELQRTLGEETSIRSLTRRILAVTILGTYTFLTLASGGVWIWNEKYADFLWELAQGQFSYMALAVAAFYFGPEMLSRVWAPKK